MTDLENDEARVLAAARRAFTPSPGDAERIRAALGAALAGGAISEAASAAPKSGPSTGPAPGASSAATSAVRVLGRLALPALVAAGGVAGYELGYRAGFREGSAVAARATPPATTVAPSVSAATVAEGAAPKLALPAPVSTAPAPLSKAAPMTSENENATAEPGLDEEVRQLRRVEHALRSGNPRYAIALLGELERQVPGGQLAEERDAARTMARCALGGDGDALAREFQAAHPRSAYVRRVTESCEKPAKESP